MLKEKKFTKGVEDESDNQIKLDYNPLKGNDINKKV